MLPNIIILTGGVSGSSVLAGLIARAGYWLGEDTKKVSYETYENNELVDLNMELLNKSGYLWRDIADIPPPSITKLSKMSTLLNLQKYKSFVKRSNEHRPFLWKDPRLSYTIFFWEYLLNLENYKFIIMMRDLKQTWTGMILRGKIPMPFKKLEVIQKNCIDSSFSFFHKEGINYHSLSFEDLIVNPEKSIDGINNFLGTHLNIADLNAVYKGQLFKARWSKGNFLMAKFKFFYYKTFLRDVITFPREK